MMKNENGFTLAEVMVAFVILLMALQLLISGSAAARNMERRANKVSGVAEILKEHLADDSKWIPGTLRLKIDEATVLVSDGWLYQNDNESENDLVINVIRAEGGN